MLEMIKQQVAINKLVRRNYEQEQRYYTDSIGKNLPSNYNSNSKSFAKYATTVDDYSVPAMPTSAKLQLPLLFVKVD